MTLPGSIWSPSEAASVNEFLNTSVGKKWLAVLMTRKPRLDLSSTERAAMTGAFAAGYEHMFNEIVSSRTVPPEDYSATKAIDMTRD